MLDISRTDLARYLQSFSKNKIFDTRETIIAALEVISFTLKNRKSFIKMEYVRVGISKSIVKANGSRFNYIKIIISKIYRPSFDQQKRQLHAVRRISF